MKLLFSAFYKMVCFFQLFRSSDLQNIFSSTERPGSALCVVACLLYNLNKVLPCRSPSAWHRKLLEAKTHFTCKKSGPLKCTVVKRTVEVQPGTTLNTPYFVHRTYLNFVYFQNKQPALFKTVLT